MNNNTPSTFYSRGKTRKKLLYEIMTYPVDEPGEAKRLWLLNLEPQDAGKLLGRRAVV